MATHYTRKKILHKLNQMYLDNYKAACSFVEANQLEQKMAIITAKLLGKPEPPKEFDPSQLDLFQRGEWRPSRLEGFNDGTEWPGENYSS